MKRTNVDFSKHILTTIIDDNVSIYKLMLPNTRMDSVIFINSCGVMSVTGDFGNWIFCREFHPSPKNKVCSGYWDEKLINSSSQKSHIYDPEATLIEINNYRDNEELTEDVVDWLDELESNVNDYYNYVYVAYRETPDSIEHEYVPFREKRKIWLDIIYDSFDEICDRMENN